jgi:hypothetical protein
MNNARGYGSEIMGFTQGHMEAAAQRYSNGVNHAHIKLGDCETPRPAITRAMEAQGLAGQRLNRLAAELLKRMDPLLMPEPEGTGASGGHAMQHCALSQAIDRGTGDMDAASSALESILRRLAL